LPITPRTRLGFLMVLDSQVEICLEQSRRDAGDPVSDA